MKKIEIEFTPTNVYVNIWNDKGEKYRVPVSIRSSTFEMLRQVTSMDSSQVTGADTNALLGGSTSIASMATTVAYKVPDEIWELMKHCMQVIDPYTIHAAAEGNIERALERVKKSKEQEAERRQKEEEMYCKNALVHINREGTIYHKGERVSSSNSWAWVLGFDQPLPEEYYGKPAIRVRYRLVAKIHDLIRDNFDLSDDIREIIKENMPEINSGEFGTGRLKACMAVS